MNNDKTYVWVAYCKDNILGSVEVLGVWRSLESAKLGCQMFCDIREWKQSPIQTRIAGFDAEDASRMVSVSREELR